MRNEPGGRLRLAAGDPGGLYLAFAEILAERLRARFSNITVDVLPTEGTVENLARLRSGDVDMGLALADVAERDRATGPAEIRTAGGRAGIRELPAGDRAGLRCRTDSSQISKGSGSSIGPPGSGAAATSEVLFDAAGLRGRLEMVNYRLRDGLAQLASGGIEALVWSGGVPTPAVAELDAEMPLRMLDIGHFAPAMSRLAGYPYVVRRVPTGEYVPPGIRSLGVPDLLLCRQGIDSDLVSAVVNVLATDAPQLVPPYVRGLQYLAAPTMIQTGLIPLHPGGIREYRTLHG